MKHSVQINSATGNLDLLVTIKWDSMIPTGFNIDGYLYHMGEDTLTPSLQAWDHCYPGRNSTWVRTTNESVCIGEPPPNCPQNLTADKGCLCDINSCSLTMKEIETRCRGVRHFVGANFVSTSFDTRMLTFKVEFFKHYQFRLRPHYREAVRLISNLYEVPAFSDCVQTIRNDFPHMTNLSVENLCCAAGVPQTTPRDVTIGRFIPDIRNGGVTDVSVEITWRPPVTQENLVDVEILI
uniref:Uncharacterized protein n=1 Tax=Ciona savignyi TaxID=51511 RepID=H2YM56_CIOSA